MKTITEYRKESTLDRLIRIEGKVITRKEWLNSMHNNGYTVRSAANTLLKTSLLEK